MKPLFLVLDSEKRIIFYDSELKNYVKEDIQEGGSFADLTFKSKYRKKEKENFADEDTAFTEDGQHYRIEKRNVKNGEIIIKVFIPEFKDHSLLKLLDNIYDAAAVIDKNANIKRFSQGMKDNFNFKSDVSGKSLPDILGVSNKNFVETVREFIDGSGKTLKGKITLTGFDSQGIYALHKIPGSADETAVCLNTTTRKIGTGDGTACRNFKDLVGWSGSMQNVCSRIRKVAPTESTVLITGETGTGKELAARGVHDHSNRADKEFIKVDCASLSDQLLESELFGHKKGAFTGAVKDREGRLKKADGGTLFLDEIGDMSSLLQSRLLRVLQDGRFERVGGDETQEVDVRTVAATNKDLEKEIEKGNFRDDLFFRLNIYPINLPPLREHKKDIPYLINFFVDKYIDTHYIGNSENFSGMTKEAQRVFEMYDWPGNIRELENTVKYALVNTSNESVTPEDLPPKMTEKGGNTEAPDSNDKERKVKENIDFGCLDDPRKEKQRILKALEKKHWNIGETAEFLGISRTTLWRKMKKYEIDD